jgi:hypothetical protein
MIYSDQTIAEALAARFRAARMFELFALQTAHDEVYMSARFFDGEGHARKVTATAPDVARSLLGLLAEIDRVLALSAHPIEVVRETDAAPRPKRPAPCLSDGKAAALAIAANNGVVTKRILAAELNCTAGAAAAVLRALVADVKLEFVQRGFVLISSGGQP